eukprot:2976895-Pleurochrysis_carterae.AAC.1
MDNLAEERKLSAKATAECEQLRANLAKAIVQLRAAAAVQNRLDHAKADLAAVGKRSDTLVKELHAAKSPATKQ